jgi:hypothetical protein
MIMTRATVAVIIQPAACTPLCLLIRPNTNENGRKMIQEKVLVPDATPARMVDGTASCSSWLTWMLTMTSSRASTIWASAITTMSLLALRVRLAAMVSMATTASGPGRSRRTFPASSPATPKVDMRPAQYGP